MFRIVPANSTHHISQAQILFREYGAMPEVGVCVVNFEEEIRSLPGVYAPPSGRLSLAIEESDAKEKPAVGCAALREWDRATGICELKPLYVRNDFRGHRVGTKLLEASIHEARSIGYMRMVLDTLPSMVEAHNLYQSIGFREIPAYQKNPIPGALFFELTLS